MDQEDTAYVWLEFQKEKENEAEAIFEEIIVKHFIKVINYSLSIDLKNKKEDRLKEIHAEIYCNQTEKYPQTKSRS